MEIKKAKKLSGFLAIPGDKSISHRAVMFGSLAEGTTKITNFLEGAELSLHYFLFPENGY